MSIVFVFMGFEPAIELNNNNNNNFTYLPKNPHWGDRFGFFFDIVTLVKFHVKLVSGVSQNFPNRPTILSFSGNLAGCRDSSMSMRHYDKYRKSMIPMYLLNSTDHLELPSRSFNKFATFKKQFLVTAFFLFCRYLSLCVCASEVSRVVCITVSLGRTAIAKAGRDWAAHTS